MRKQESGAGWIQLKPTEKVKCTDGKENETEGDGASGPGWCGKGGSRVESWGITLPSDPEGLGEGNI